jgi:hypothetical protein
MDQVDTYNLSATDTFAIIGGEIMIDDDGTSAASKGCVRFDDTAGKLQFSHDCSTYSNLGDASGITAPGSDREMIFNSGGSLATDTTLVYTSAGNLGIGTASPIAALDVRTGTVVSDGETVFHVGATDLTAILYRSSNEGFLEVTTDWGSSSPHLRLSRSGSEHIDFEAEYGVKLKVTGTHADKEALFAMPLAANELQLNASSETVKFWPDGNNAGADLVIETRQQSDATFYERMRILDTGEVGIGTATPATLLDVVGAVKVDYDATTCDSTIQGAIRYDSGGNALSFCDSSTWQTIANTGSTVAAGADREIQFNSGSSMGADTNFVYTSAGDFIVGSYQLDDTGTGSEDARMFFDVSKGAFRAGSASGAAWDNVNVGTKSTAFGRDNTASGNDSFAVGAWSVASGTNATAIGQGATASGFRSVALGDVTTADGYIATAMGGATKATGDLSLAFGYKANTGNGSLVGSGLPFGDHPGDFSVAFGLGNATLGSNPQVSGISSFGIFMGNQAGVDLSSSNTLGLFGGKMVIDPNVPATNLSADVALDVTGAVKVDYDATTCDSTIQGAIRYDSGGNALSFCDASSWQTIASSGSTAAAGSDREIQFNSGSSLGADSTFVYTASGNLGVGTTAPQSVLHVTGGDPGFYGYGNTTGSKIDLDLFRSRGSEGSEASVVDTDQVGMLRFNAYDGDQYHDVAYIGAIINDPSAGDNNLDTNIVFATTSATSMEEHARIYHNDVFAVGDNLADVRTYHSSTAQEIVAFGGNPDFHATAFSADKGDYTLTKYNGTTASPTAIADGDEIGTLRWAGYDGSGASANDTRRASILGVVNGAVSNNTVPIDIVFKTSPTVNEGTERMRILSSGEIGIGTVSPTQALDVVGNIQHSGVIIDASDRRLKKDITPLDAGTVLERLAQVDTYSFRMKDDPMEQIEFGVIAQELEEAFPELVITSDDEMQTKHVNYIGLIAPLVEATNSLRTENETLKAEMAAKEDRMAAIEARMASFENDLDGMKVHTGYGFTKASIGALMLLMLILSGGLIVVIRKRQS